MDMASGNVFGELPDPLFRSSWKDAPDEIERLRRRPGSADEAPLGEAAALLAHDALAHLDTLQGDRARAVPRVPERLASRQIAIV